MQRITIWKIKISRLLKGSLILIGAYSEKEDVPRQGERCKQETLIGYLIISYTIKSVWGFLFSCLAMMSRPISTSSTSTWWRASTSFFSEGARISGGASYGKLEGCPSSYCFSCCLFSQSQSSCCCNCLSSIFLTLLQRRAKRAKGKEIGKWIKLMSIQPNLKYTVNIMRM